MTEDEWQSARDAGPMVDWLRKVGRLTPRKSLLLRVALGRLLGPGTPHVASLLDELENLADAGRRSGEARARQAVIDHDIALAFFALPGGDLSLRQLAAWPNGRAAAASPGVAAFPGLVREIFGNPLRPVRRVSERLRDRVLRQPPENRTTDRLFVNEWLTWGGGLIPKLAAGVVADRAYDRLPVLGDALEDAGCHDAELLGHCRGGGPHVPGCWVLDLILGKE
ncbi:MAG: hypothetical protein ACRC33_19750 [Gemmataceae bacterium]